MRHRVAHRKLGRVTEHRIALLRNQATNLIRHERIETTLPKAKELRPFVEKLITIAKDGAAEPARSVKRLNAKRAVARDIQDTTVVEKLFDTIAPRFSARPGGYTRILKLGFRRGDAADIAQIELVGSEYNPALDTETPEAAQEAPPKPKGVRSRLAAAAKRLRGEGKPDAAPKASTTAKAPARRRATKKTDA